MSLTKLERRQRIKLRIRKRIFGTENKPRLSVFRSNKQISVQIINDLDGKTLVSASSLCKEVSETKGVNKIQQANLVGKLIAQRALDKGIVEVVFDRNGYLYHGRIKSLADAAREGGLKL
ncbi:MAG TPA: 50S ribosomal protein L18 [Bacteroidales bacterium]|nr:MAG: 50S ribosomal protein L18 [Bacteroidetes bacterium GWF2_33_38]OFY76420.1 MAG: 50S ribosomal protein L18 [Bacteroidetes bacterium RIFOXYA12_FULL_33_9]OFY90337.1 MAG: 50S ribosomal protein L18 [Bacteroidetes bacterium RIFOXYA2_FULL_33_7]HBF88168.1 50S ribosomal protein L18 [Bacteroidales bacterium]